MHGPLTALRRSRKTLAILGVVAVCGFVALRGSSPEDGIAAEDIEPLGLAEAVGAEDGSWATGALLFDLVEPEDGEGGSEDEIAAFVEELDGPLTDAGAAGFYSEGEHLVRVTGELDALVELRGRFGDHPLVEGVEPELLYALPDSALSAGPAGDDAPEAQKPSPERFVPNDPMFTLQWHMEQIHAPEAWVHARGKGAVVAVIDTGVAWKTAGPVRAVPDLAGTEFTQGQTFIKGALEDGLDDHAHGTHVAGTIAQTTHNEVGVTGVAHDATIMPLKVLSADGRGNVAGIANAVRYAADHGAHVINMSLGGPLPSRVLAKAILYAREHGVTVMCAAGNERRGRVSYPAANEGAVAVAAVDFERNPSFYTNWGKHLDLAAPGGDTRVDKNGDGHPDGVLQNTIKIQQPGDNDYLWFQGTSMATPHAAGVAALVVSAGVTEPDEVERILKDTAVHPRDVDWDDRYGAGIIDAHAAVLAAKGKGAPERSGLGGLLALAGLAGLGALGLRTRAGRVLGAATLAAARRVSRR